MPTASTVATDKPSRRLDARRARYGARDTLWKVSGLERVRHCGRFSTGDTVTVKVTRTADSVTGGFGGVQSCGSVWACPVCSEKVNGARQAELTDGIAGWLKTGAVVFGTLTLRHNRDHSLAQLLDAISPAWNKTTAGSSAWRGGKRQVGDKARFGINGYVRVLEIKHGVNGWHPHVHFLLFLDAPLSARELLDLESRMFGRWESALASKGLSVVREVGIDLRPVVVSDPLASYFTKQTYGTTPGAAAYEVTGSHSKREGKGGRTPFDLLAEVVAGDTGQAFALWREYETATHGRRQLTWSRGLRDLLALGVEKTEEEILEDDEAKGEIVCVIEGTQYARIARMRALVDVLEAAEADDWKRRLPRLLGLLGVTAVSHFTQRDR